jgi:hypothetical protein
VNEKYPKYLLNEKQLKYLQQNKKKIGFFILVFIFLIALVIFGHHTIQSNPPVSLYNKTVYVAADGSGNYTCDGSDDQVEINKALAYVAENPQFTTVYLKGPNTYVISDSILIGSNTVLEGDPTAVVKLEDNADWPVNKPLITQIDADKSYNNITIKGFEINGNHDNNKDKKNGDGYYNMIRFLNSKNIQVHNMYMHDGHGDGLRVERSSNIQYYNNKIYKLGHDGLFAIRCQNIEAWNNTITCRTNSGLRVWNSNQVKFHDNVIDSFYDWSAGGPGIQIEKGGAATNVMDDIDIYNNTIHNTYGPGIWLFNHDTVSSTKDMGKNVYIHNNVFYDTGTNPNITWVGGIVTSGFHNTTIENNVFDGVYHAAIINMYPNGYSPAYSPKPGYTTTVRNNIIVNTQKRTKDPEGTGYAVINYLPETHNLVLENNCLYNNSAGNYLNCTSTTDIYANPLFVDLNKHDYHLKSNSPCTGTGYISSYSSNNSGETVNQVNIGRYT